MKFCNNCSNMMYIKVVSDTLQTYCKCCGFIKDEPKEQYSKAIIENNISQDNVDLSTFITPLIKHDPTLPRMKNISCIKNDCPSVKTGDQEVIFMKYDPEKLKYLYFCCQCESFWKSNLKS
jgi:DNA-directed RNA polymerase subunit M/transcription elongation factor TFIIS